MADAIQDLADIPKDFFKDGTAFLNRCTKRTSLLSKLPSHSLAPSTTHPLSPFAFPQANITPISSGPPRIHQDQPSSRHGLPDHGRNRLRYQLIHIPVNNTLVGGA